MRQAGPIFYIKIPTSAALKMSEKEIRFKVESVILPSSK